MSAIGKLLRTLTLVSAMTLVAVVAARAQDSVRAGIVTALEGRATVVRASLTRPAPLKFKDDIFVHDRIATGESSIARILLGGKAIVTIRERSIVTITEVPGVSTVSVGSGRVAVAVVKERMKHGELVEIRTPNAVAGIRGTIVVAEVARDRSLITVLRGLIDVTRLDQLGRAIGAPVVVGALQQISVHGLAPAPLAPPRQITPQAAQSLAGEFKTAPPKNVPAASMAPLNQAEVERAAAELLALLPPAPTVDRLSGGVTDSDKRGKDDSKSDDTKRNDDSSGKRDDDSGGRTQPGASPKGARAPEPDLRGDTSDRDSEQGDRVTVADDAKSVRGGRSASSTPSGTGGSTAAAPSSSAATGDTTAGPTSSATSTSSATGGAGASSPPPPASAGGPSATASTGLASGNAGGSTGGTGSPAVSSAGGNGAALGNRGSLGAVPGGGGGHFARVDDVKALKVGNDVKALKIDGDGGKGRKK